MAYHEDSSASGQDEPWIQWFCSLKGHEMFCKVERSYIEDGFNLYGLRACVSNFSDCLDLILDRIGPDDSDDSHLTQSACTLYALIHARYVITAHGLDAMYNKYANKEFGTCPLIQCYGQPVLPVGLKDEMGADTVKIFCPKCQNVYHPPPMRSRNSHGSSHSSAAVDGAAFGTTFAHLFLMTFNNLVPDGLSQESVYVPKVFGFRVHPSARQRSGNNSNVVVRSSKGSLRMPITQAITNGNGDGGDASVPQQVDAKMDLSASKPAGVEGAADAGAGASNEQGQSYGKNKKGKGRKNDAAKRRVKNGDDIKSKRPRRP